MYTKLLIEQHFHGAYGVDFNKASVSEVCDLAHKMKKDGIGGIFPTLVTDTVENIKKQINVIKEAAQKKDNDCAKIFGIHLEGIFLNPEKKGIHNSEHFLEPTIENFNLVADDFIKIVTLAPELCNVCARQEKNLINYLVSKGVKVQAGHCVGGDLTGCSGVTHMFNAMGAITHRTRSTTLSALLEDNIYAEIIGDCVHVGEDALKLLFKVKPEDKIILVSDCLPCTHSNITEFNFADEKVFFDGERAISAQGVLAGSTKLLPDIIKILAKKSLFNPKYIENPYKYHNIELSGKIEWDEDFNIVNVVP